MIWLWRTLYRQSFVCIEAFPFSICNVVLHVLI